MEPINILVVGECGDGKSTLIEHMRDKDKSEAVVCGKNPRGAVGPVQLCVFKKVIESATMILIDQSV